MRRLDISDILPEGLKVILVGNSEDDDDYWATPYQFGGLVFVVITVLIMITILFEFLKDFAIESSSKYARPIVLTLFSEMTVLGFLSLVTFAVAYGGTLTKISEQIYGNSGEDFIDETLETIHYLIFLVMVLTIFQVFALINIGSNAMRDFDRQNLIAQKEEDIIPIIKRIDHLPHVTYTSWTWDYLSLGPAQAWKKHTERNDVEYTAIFYSLRREFIECRSSIEPYHVSEKSKQLPESFDFAKYQTLFLSNYLTRIVSFTPLTWAALWIGTVFVYCLMMICNGTYLALALLWLGLGYVDMIIIYSLQRKCYVILEHLLNPSHFFPPTNSDNDYGGIEERPTEKLMEEGRGAGDGGPKGGADASAKTSAGEGTSLLGGDDVTILKTGHIADMVQDVLVHDFDAVLDENTHSSLVVRLKKARLDLPLWVNVDVDQQEQSWLSYLSLGPAVPNKQEALFWGDKIGRDVNIYILRVHLIVQSIYFSILVCFFIPFTFEDYGYWGIPYTVAGLLPFFVQYFGFYPHLVMQMSLVASSGLFKEKKMVTEVIRTQKLAKLMRLLMLMTKLRATKKPAMDAGEATPKKAYDMNDPKVRAEIDEISKIFDMYDEDNSGEVEIDELANMFRSFGISLNETEMKEMFVTLDADNSGSVSKEELIDWKMGQETHDKASEMKNMAKEIFEMFDTDGSGEITVEEFKRGLEQFHSGLTHGEIMEIAQDLDESGDGNISLDEFEKAIEQALE